MVAIPATLRTILSPARPVRSHTLSEGCRAHSEATKTRPSLDTTAEDCGTSCAVNQSGKYSHVQVSINHPQMRAVLSLEEEKTNMSSTAMEVTRDTIGQNAPALVSHIVPRQRKYWAMPTPKMQGTTPNTVAMAIAFRRIVEFSIHCSFRKTRGKNRIEVAHYSG